jgi:hypothetical protein
VESVENRTLLTDGDALERSTWTSVRDLFPHYEEFWQVHLLPLRGPMSIQPRRGIDEDFEFLAMFHYSTYVNVQRAIEKSRNAEDGGFRFPDEVYLRLYAAAELGFKVVEQFWRIHEACLGEKPDVSSEPLRHLMGTFGKYRNLVHEQVPAVCSDAYSNVTMPRREKIEDYRKWTTVLYDAKPEDFISVQVQVNNDLHALCSALEDAWKKMCRLSGRLTSNTDYLSRRGAGETSRAPVRENMLTSSNTAVYSATAAGAVLLGDFGISLNKK